MYGFAFLMSVAIIKLTNKSSKLSVPYIILGLLGLAFITIDSSYYFLKYGKELLSRTEPGYNFKYACMSNLMSLFTVVIPLFIVYFGIPLFYSNAAVLATFRVPDKPNASSIMSFLNIGGSVIGLIFIQILHLNPLYAMPSVFILVIILVIVLFRKGQKLIED